MGRLGNILEISSVDKEGVKTVEVRIEIAANHIITPAQFLAPGVDAKPLKTDMAVTTSVPGNDKHAVVGYLNAADVDLSKPGEIGLYSRNALGARVATVYLKKDGTIEMENLTGKVTMSPSLGLTIQNGPGSIIISPAGSVSINGKLTVAP